METPGDLMAKFTEAYMAHNREGEIKNEECKKMKEFTKLVLEKLKRHEYMELTYRDVGQNVTSVVIGQGWVGTRTSAGDLTFEPVMSDFNPCIGSKEYPARILLAAIASPDRAEIKVKEIRRHEFNSSYFSKLDKFISAQAK